MAEVDATDRAIAEGARVAGDAALETASDALLAVPTPPGAEDRAEVVLSDNASPFPRRLQGLWVDPGNFTEITRSERSFDRVREHVLARLNHLAGRVAEDHDVRVDVLGKVARRTPLAFPVAARRVVRLEHAADLGDAVCGHQRRHDVVEGRQDVVADVRLDVFLAESFCLGGLPPLDGLAHQLRYVDRDRLVV